MKDLSEHCPLISLLSMPNSDGIVPLSELRVKLLRAERGERGAACE